MSAKTLKCVMMFESTLDALRVLETVSQKIDPDRIVEDKILSFPDGMLKVNTRQFVIRDLFDKIEVTSVVDTYFHITFHVREGADHYWGDVVVSIIHSSLKDSKGNVKFESVK
jgi:hypothetical protein